MAFVVTAYRGDSIFCLVSWPLLHLLRILRSPKEDPEVHLASDCCVKIKYNDKNTLIYKQRADKIQRQACL